MTSISVRLPVSNYTQPTSVGSISMKFLETVWAAWDLVQLVQRSSTGKSYLDLISTSYINNYGRVAMHSPVLTSDRDLVLCKWRAAKNPTKPAIPRLNFKKANYDAISAV